MKREIIRIDEDRCTGCGLCVPNCPEGALQIIDGKARLVSDLFCDGLGACIGHCPEGAIEIEEREAEPYDEKKVMENIIRAGPNTIKAHLSHLKEHGEFDFFKQAVEVLREKGLDMPVKWESGGSCGGGCPGTKMMEFAREGGEAGDVISQLRQWPVQLHLVPPTAPYYRGADVVLSADCVAYALSSFHSNHLKGKAVAIACPKLDTNKEAYVEKLKAMIDDAGINTLTVMTMEVPCCGGLLQIAKAAASDAGRRIPVKSVVVGIQGGILKEEWVNTG